VARWRDAGFGAADGIFTSTGEAAAIALPRAPGARLQTAPTFYGNRRQFPTGVGAAIPNWRDYRALGAKPAPGIDPFRPAYFAATTGDVQFGQRLALIGIVEQHSGHSFVVGSAAGGPFFSRFICLTTKKMAKATMAKSRML